MIVYRTVEREAVLRPALDAQAAALARIAAGGALDREAATHALIAFGEIEAGVTDAVHSAADGVSPTAGSARRIGLAIGRLFRCAVEGESGAATAAAALEGLDALRRCDLPERIVVRTPEGFAWYGLHPETYLAAAERFAREAGPAEAVVIGLRSIGTALSAVVAAGLEAQGWTVDSVTVRPKGHPFDRKPILDPALEDWLRARVGRFMLIVDEGPGLSGSSFCGAAEAVSRLGTADEKIIFFPSWRPEAGGFVSEAARARWGRHRAVHVAFDEVFGHDFEGAETLSAGLWRGRLYESEAEWPAVHPHHERRKFLKDGALRKFVGLGRYGETKRLLAEGFAEKGFGPQVLGLKNGFLASAFVEGRPLRRRDLDGRLMSFAARALGARAALSPVRGAPRLDDLFMLIETNVRLALGEDELSRLSGLERLRPILEGAPALAIDGRCLPHEWIATAAGFLKVDAIDHYDGHFHPGPADLAWDAAGFVTEFGLTSAEAADFVAAMAREAGDLGIAARVPFYEVAYLAFRLGYAVMAEPTLAGSAEGRRFEVLKRFYRSALRQAIGRFILKV